jgi:hypothetical protein
VQKIFLREMKFIWSFMISWFAQKNKWHFCSRKKNGGLFYCTPNMTAFDDKNFLSPTKSNLILPFLYHAAPCSVWILDIEFKKKYYIQYLGFTGPTQLWDNLTFVKHKTQIFDGGYSALGWVDFRLFLHFQQKYPWDLLYTFQKYRK